MRTHNWLDRAIGYVSPQSQLRRVRARMATELVMRHYEAAGIGRRTQGWKRTNADVNAATAPFVGTIRDQARDLVRNNAYAESALKTIVNQAVGWGLVAKAEPMNRRAMATWNEWAGTTACDADGRNDFPGLQKLIVRSVAESGEVLVRRRIRRPEDGLPIPLQIQVLEPDFLDTAKHGIKLPNGGRIVYGVEFDPIGRKVAYWLFPEHPGNSAFPAAASQRIPAEGLLHVFRQTRPGQARAGSWFAPVILRMKDFDEYEDATLMKQKIAACLAVITSDVDGSAASLGTADDTSAPGVDLIEPGSILNVPPGRTVEVVQPPSVREYKDYSETSLRAQAAGLGVTYEDMTGDYTELPFSAARMSRLRIWDCVEDTRWRMLVPQFCDPVWKWAMQASEIMGTGSAPAARWTAPPMAMIEPDKEGLAIQRNVRSGIQTLSDAIRERGYDPDEFLAELAADFKKLDALGLILDIDPRKMTQTGQLQGEGLPKSPEPTEPDPEDEERRRLAWRR
jgi:lambda family phage portal protein